MLTGGVALTNGLGDRLKKDLRENFAPDSVINIEIVNEPILGAYQGMQLFNSQYGDMVRELSITKQDYEEYGESYDIFKTNPFSNVIIPLQKSNSNNNTDKMDIEN